MGFIYAIPAIVWLLISAGFFAWGEFLSKKFAIAPSALFVVVILFAYGLSELAWLPAILQKHQLSIVGVLWSVLSLLATVLIGIVVFGERVNALGMIGIVLAFISVVLLSLA